MARELVRLGADGARDGSGDRPALLRAGAAARDGGRGGLFGDEAAVPVDVRSKDGRALFVAASCGRDAPCAPARAGGGQRGAQRQRRLSAERAAFNGHLHTVQLLVSLGVDARGATRSTGTARSTPPPRRATTA